MKEGIILKWGRGISSMLHPHSPLLTEDKFMLQKLFSKTRRVTG